MERGGGERKVMRRRENINKLVMMKMTRQEDLKRDKRKRSFDFALLFLLNIFSVYFFNLFCYY
jgi:hypothetical protein